MNSDATKPASQFLLDLAAGKYDAQVAAFEKMLLLLTPEFPIAGEISMLVRGFITFNRITAPAHVVPDGRGGWVPDTNSHIK